MDAVGCLLGRRKVLARLLTTYTIYVHVASIDPCPFQEEPCRRCFQPLAGWLEFPRALCRRWLHPSSDLLKGCFRPRLTAVVDLILSLPFRFPLLASYVLHRHTLRG